MSDLTKLIVVSYINDVISLFCANDNPYYNIPCGISMIIVSYINNFADNIGLYEWKIDDILLVNKMLNAKCGDKFESKPFVLSRLKCKLLIYPNGNKPELKGYFVMHLHIDLASYIDQIIFCRVFRVKENMTGSVWMSTIKNGEYEYWSKKCPLSEIINLKCKTITIEIQLNIQKLILKNDFQHNILKECKLPSISRKFAMKSHIEYDFNKEELNILRNCQPFGKSMCSDIVDNMWCITVHPKETSPSYIDVYLRICCLPPNVKNIDVYYTLECDAIIDNDCEYRNIFCLDDHAWGAETWIMLDQIKNIQNLKFIVDLEIKKIKYQDNTTKDLEISNPSHIAYLLSTS